MNYSYTLILSDRRTIAAEIRNGALLVRAPRRVTKRQIEAFLSAHRAWIDKHLAAASPAAEKLTEQELSELTKRARDFFAARVAHYAPLVGVSPGRITVRHQKSRWGSASAKGNLNFNCLLLLAPPEVADSVVVHELCHLKVMDHSPRFYAEVTRVFPDYRRHNRFLKDHGAELLARLP